MTLHVQRKVVRARERPLAQSALERAVASVLAVVTSQLIRAGELPTAALPAALVRLLARVCAEVRLQVRRLRIRLGTPRICARVSRHFLTPPASSPSLCLCRSGDLLLSRKKRGRWRCVQVMWVVPEVGKMWRCWWGHHPDVGVVVVGKTL
jgi:hypothetical protein